MNCTHEVKPTHCFGCHKEFSNGDSLITLRSGNAFVVIHNNTECEKLVRDSNPIMRYAALANYQ